MRKLFTVLLIILVPFIVRSQSNHVVISQVFGGGGNTNAPFKNDFIELFNPTSNAVNLTGWSVQYSGAANASWNNNKIDLSGSIAPGKYFLIQCSSSGNTGVSLPTPDLIATANVNISATSGKVALVGNTTVLLNNCPDFSVIID